MRLGPFARRKSGGTEVRGRFFEFSVALKYPRFQTAPLRERDRSWPGSDPTLATFWKYVKKSAILRSAKEDGIYPYYMPIIVKTANLAIIRNNSWILRRFLVWSSDPGPRPGATLTRLGATWRDPGATCRSWTSTWRDPDSTWRDPGSTWLDLGEILTQESQILHRSSQIWRTSVDWHEFENFIKI